MATIYFSIEGSDITDGVYPDTDCDSADIEVIAQQLEYNLMDRLGLSAAPSGTAQSESLKHALILLTAAELESREPHSQADGAVRMDKFSRVLWKSDAEEIIHRFERVLSKT
jgi:hypothetical protein